MTQDTVRGIRRYFWAYTNSHILYLQDQGGDENWKVYAVDLGSNTSRDLTPFDSIPARRETDPAPQWHTHAPNRSD